MTALRDRLAANDAMPSLAGYRALAEDAIREAEAATPADSLDALTLAEAMWFEGLIDTTTPTEPAALSGASSLLSAIEGLRRSRTGQRFPRNGLDVGRLTDAIREATWDMIRATQNPMSAQAQATDVAERAAVIYQQSQRSPRNDEPEPPLTDSEALGLIRKALADGYVLDRFVGSVPIFHRAEPLREALELIFAADRMMSRKKPLAMRAAIDEARRIHSEAFRDDPEEGSSKPSEPNVLSREMDTYRAEQRTRLRSKPGCPKHDGPWATR